MVENRKTSGFAKIVTELKLMTVIILLPYLGLKELYRFCRFNKSSYKLMLKYVNFKVLFEAQGLNLTSIEIS